MGVTALPGPPQFGMGQQDPGALVRVALAVKQAKMAETQQKRENAMQTLDMLMKNPQLLLLTDPKEVEKQFKELGIKFNDKPPVNPASPLPTTGAATPGLPAATSGGPVGDALGVINNASKPNASGAQAGAPASNQAAAKAPGGGVTPGFMDQVAAKAQEAFTQKYGALAPLYGQAMSQVELESIKAKGLAEIEQLKANAAGGDFQSMGRLYALAGHEITDSTLRGLIASSNMDPTVVSQAMDLALGNESPKDKAQRFNDTLKTLTSSPSFMEKLQNPTDITEIARSVVYGGKLPEGVGSLRANTLQELNAEADYEMHLVNDVGLNYDQAHFIARSRTLGIDMSNSLPPAMRSLLLPGGPTLAQQKGAATGKQAEASLLSAQAEMKKAQSASASILATLSSKQYEDLNDRLKDMIEADKAKHPWPEDIREGLLSQVAVASGRTPEEVHSWYNIMGGHSMRYVPSPDSDIAKAAAGGPQSRPDTPPGTDWKSFGRTIENLLNINQPGRKYKVGGQP